MKLKSKNAISLSINDGYVWHAQCLLKSLQRNWPDHPIVLVQHTGLSKQSESVLGSFPGVLFCHSARSIEGPPINLAPAADRWATYLRLNLWNDDFADYDGILYLDADTIVLKPLDEILAINEFVIFKDQNADTLGMFIDRGNQALQDLLSLDGFILGADMANAGVFVIPKRYRSGRAFEEITALLDRYNTYIRFADQTIINLWMLKHNIKPVDDRRYNFLVRQPHKVLQSLGLENVRILHFAGFAEQSPRRKLLMRLAPVLAANQLSRPLYVSLQRFVINVGG